MSKVPTGMINAYVGILKDKGKIVKSYNHTGGWVYAYEMPGYNGNVLRKIGKYYEEGDNRAVRVGIKE